MNEDNYLKFKNSKEQKFLFLYSSFSDLSNFLLNIVKNYSSQTIVISDTISKALSFYKIAEQYISKDNIEIIHKNLNKTQIFSAYKNINSGKTKLIIGTKTAIFSPFSNLKTIIILDEESIYHKQYDQNPRYNVKDVAEYMANISKDLKLIYTSSSPSIETYNKNLEIINIKDNIKKELNIIFIEGDYIDTIKDNIEKAQELNKKVVIINNNRLHSSSIICNDCGYIEKCEKCNIPLKLDKNINKEVCKICGLEKDIISYCPVCKSTNIKFIGIGNQKIYQKLSEIYQNKKIKIIDKSIRQININEINSLDIIIGTDFLIKNYLAYINNIYSLILFSVDDYFIMPDFKSNEFMFRYIVNITNIAKEKNIDKIYIKTKHKNDAILNYALSNDYLSFFQEEIKTRKLLNYPPFSIIIKLIIKDKNKKEYDKKIAKIKDILYNAQKIETLGENTKLNKNETHIIIKINKEEYNNLKDIIKNISKYALLDINPEFLIK